MSTRKRRAFFGIAGLLGVLLLGGLAVATVNQIREYVLIRALDSQDVARREAAMETLAGLGSLEALGILLETAKTDTRVLFPAFPFT